MSHFMAKNKMHPIIPGVNSFVRLSVRLLDGVWHYQTLKVKYNACKSNFGNSA